MSTVISLDAFIPFSHGFLLNMSAIMALGPQNLFVLRQGLHRRHAFIAASVSTFAEIVLATLAIGGMGTLIASSSAFVMMATVAGVAFLTGYGLCLLRSARRSDGDIPECRVSGCMMRAGAVVAAALSVAFLNPSAYVDMVLILTPAASQLPASQRFLFGTGAVLAACVWFFGLSYGARLFEGFLKRPGSASILDRLSGWMMIGMAVMLAWRQA